MNGPGKTIPRPLSDTTRLRVPRKRRQIMDWTWINTTGTAVVMVLASTVGIYLSTVLLTRLAGLRSFSKMSSFDFAVTVAIGSVIATTILSKSPPLLQSIAALACLYGVQMAVAAMRTRWSFIRTGVDNAPLLLMAGQEIIEENMHKAKVTEADLIAKLREANVIDLKQIRAVVMESTGDVSVLHCPPGGPDLDEWLLKGVGGGERLTFK
jgi:uncharacterized membrane protein YcaP (DUF421 family)